MRELRPTGFILENVAALAFEPCRPLFSRLTNSLSRAGYRVSWRVVNAASFGVAQKRERLFVVGLKNGRRFEFPEPTHSPEDYVPVASVFRRTQR